MPSLDQRMQAQIKAIPQETVDSLLSKNMGPQEGNLSDNTGG